MKIRSFIGNKAFYKTVMTVAAPIMLQNFIANLVNMLDNLMVGAVGTEQMSGVSIVNQLIFVFNLALFGGLSGAGIFTSQFFGKKDSDGIRYTIRYKIGVSVVLFIVALAVFLLFGDKLISLFLHDVDPSCDIEATADYARQYLLVILIGLFPFTVSQILSSTLRETCETVAPMLIGFVAVVTNCVFNYLLIFGNFGFPKLGVVGAAIATVLSRYVECAIIIIYVIKKRSRFPFIKGSIKSLYIPRDLFKLITFKGTPLLFNEFFWSVGMSLLSIGFSLHGISVVAGYSICSTVINLFNITFLSLGSSIGIIVGKQLGAGEYDKAVDYDRKLIAFSVALSVLIGIIVFSLGKEIPEVYNTSEISKEYASYFIRVCAIFIPANAFANAAYFTLRCGGKTLVTFLFDSVFALLFSVPVAFSLYYVFHLSIYAIFPIVQALEIIKDIIGLIMIKKRVWVNNIVGTVRTEIESA